MSYLPTPALSGSGHRSKPGFLSACLGKLPTTLLYQHAAGWVKRPPPVSCGENTHSFRRWSVSETGKKSRVRGTEYSRRRKYDNARGAQTRYTLPAVKDRAFNTIARGTWDLFPPTPAGLSPGDDAGFPTAGKTAFLDVIYTVPEKRKECGQKHDNMRTLGVGGVKPLPGACS